MSKTERVLLSAQAAAARPPLGEIARTARALKAATTKALALYCRRKRGK